MNRFTSLMLLTAATCVGLGAATADSVFKRVAADDARRADVVVSQTNAAIVIWSDKYVYRPGESLTLRLSMNPNGDEGSYTLFAYRVNNQTGARTFLPGGAATPTDVFGRTAGTGYDVARLSSHNRTVLVGANGALGALTIPNELGMHTIVLEVRDTTASRVVKSAYWKIGVVDGVDDLSGNVDQSRTLVNTRAYRIQGVVSVRNNAVLTIQPGTFIFGQPGSQPPSVLLITRTGRINANGTRTQPIIMTSREPDTPIGTRQRGDWGGLLMLGQAPANTPAANTFVEGLNQSDDTRYGGTDAAWNCGTTRYVRVEYAGVQLTQANETNAFVWSGCGTGTTAEYLQAHYGNDDAFEWFGGSVNGKYFVATYTEDDNFDFQLGWTGNLQFGVALQAPSARGNRGIEGDNSEFDFSATPASNPNMYNLTLVGSGQPGSSEGNSPGIFLRRGARGSFNNILVTNFSSAGLDVTEAPTQANIDNNTLTLNGLLLWNNGLGTSAANTIAGQVTSANVTFAEGTRGTGRNVTVADPMLRNPLAYSDPDFRPMAGSPVYGLNWSLPPSNGFFDQSAGYIGAFGDVNWTEEWTNFHLEEEVTATAPAP